MKAILGGFYIGLTVLSGGMVAGCAGPQAGDPAAADSRPVASTAAPSGAGTADAGAGPKVVAPGAVAAGPAVAGASPGVPVVAAASFGSDQVVARVAGRPITLGQLMPPLIESHGMTTLLALAQLELARDGAEKKGLTVTADDVRREREQTLNGMFEKYDEQMDEKIAEAEKAKKPEDAERLRKEKRDSRENLLAQALGEQRVSLADFELGIRTNAYLRKLAEPVLKDPATGQDQITEDMLRKQWGLKYGEKVHVRHIQVKRPTDIHEARRRLAAGEPFEKVAREMSTMKQTAVLGGDIPPFTRQANLPQNFKDTAFALTQVGQLSDMVEADNAYHLIQLVERIEPKAAKYEDVRDAVYRDLHEQFVQAIMKNLRDQMGEQIRTALKIEEPILGRQFQQRLAARESLIKNREQAIEEIEKERKAEAERAAAEAATRPSTGPTTQPGATGATQPRTLPSNLQPGPATTQPATTQPAAAAAVPG